VVTEFTLILHKIPIQIPLARARSSLMNSHVFEPWSASPSYAFPSGCLC